MLEYEKAGVSIRAGEDLVDAIKKDNPYIGGFAGLYPLDEERYLVACTDGVGTKLELSQQFQKHHELGQDLVAMSVNDLIVCGARPLFFLDYYATGKLNVTTAKLVIKGIQDACTRSHCVLLGGETAEMPGFYQGETFDLAGFAVGEVFKNKLIDGKSIQHGDAIIGLPSSGFHANGYSLIRHLIKKHKVDLLAHCKGTLGSLADALTAPTRLYVDDIQRAMRKVTIKGMAHITGGGLSNIARVLPPSLTYQIDRSKIPLPPVIEFFKNLGSVAEEECYQVWNMGLGFVIIVDAGEVDQLLETSEGAFAVGKVTTKI